MSAVMVIHMDIRDEGWIAPYFAAVSPLLAEYGAVPLAGSRAVRLLEGEGPAPDRLAVIRFPSLAALERFMADRRYQQFRRLREAGSTARLFVFEDQAINGALA